MTTSSTQHVYVFDVKLFATLRVEAQNESSARSIIADVMNAADCNGGMWPDGTPVLFEASIDGEADLISVDNDDII